VGPPVEDTQVQGQHEHHEQVEENPENEQKALREWFVVARSPLNYETSSPS
jgi:hypothetical protein